jgi:hypothetical protein
MNPRAIYNGLRMAWNSLRPDPLEVAVTISSVAQANMGLKYPEAVTMANGTDGNGTKRHFVVRGETPSLKAGDSVVYKARDISAYDSKGRRYEEARGLKIISRQVPEPAGLSAA